MDRGACCLDDGRCVVATRARCRAAGGEFQGAGTRCAGVKCDDDAGCPCDWNGDKRLNQADVFDFIEALLAGKADYNGDGVTNVRDLIEFIQCVLNPPRGCN
jgi:hypothetical protein